MRNPFTAFRRCRELENENLQLKSTCKDLRKQLENITAMRADLSLAEVNGVCNVNTLSFDISTVSCFAVREP